MRWFGVDGWVGEDWEGWDELVSFVPVVSDPLYSEDHRIVGEVSMGAPIARGCPVSVMIGDRRFGRVVPGAGPVDAWMQACRWVSLLPGYTLGEAGRPSSDWGLEQQVRAGREPPFPVSIGEVRPRDEPSDRQCAVSWNHSRIQTPGSGGIQASFLAAQWMFLKRRAHVDLQSDEGDWSTSFRATTRDLWDAPGRLPEAPPETLAFTQIREVEELGTRTRVQVALGRPERDGPAYRCAVYVGGRLPHPVFVPGGSASEVLFRAIGIVSRLTDDIGNACGYPPVRRRKAPYVRTDVTGDPSSPVLDVTETGLRLSIGVPTPRDPHLPEQFECRVQVGDRSRMAFGSGVVDTLQWARMQFCRLQNPEWFR